MDLADRFELALTRDDVAQLDGATPTDRADRFRVLLAVYDLHLGDVAVLGERARYAQHPAIAGLKWRLEGTWLTELATVGEHGPCADVEDCVGRLRTIAARDRLPRIYQWLADDADWPSAVEFLALEGGPDGGFDDLVAACQIGLSGEPKLELARNYWDEMGNGSLDQVHTALHQRLVSAMSVPQVPRAQLTESALERAALGGLLTTNHWLQPEMIGALGLIELQAGPRCRLVLQALERLGAPDDAYPFYVEHAEVDPLHGKHWVDNVVVPLAEEHPSWRMRMVRGASWRAQVNAAFLDEMWHRLTGKDTVAA